MVVGGQATSKQASGSWRLEATDSLRLEDGRGRGGVFLDRWRGSLALPADQRSGADITGGSKCRSFSR
jgi:hypothetical protein